MANFTVQNNTSAFLDVDSLFLLQGWELLTGGVLRHSSSKTTSVSKSYPLLNLGQSYDVSFTISNYVSCQLFVKFGNYISDAYSENGTYTFTQTLEGSKTVEFIGNGYFDVTNLSINTMSSSFEIVDYNDADIFENKSYTVSFNPAKDRWISYHSYMPDNYIPHPTDFIMFKDQELQISDGDNYQQDMPFVIETVMNDNPMFTRVMDSITVNSDTFTGSHYNNVFFDKLWVYTTDQSSGEIILNATNLTRKEKDWNINRFNDISRYNNKQDLFTSAWADIKNNYYCDKAINLDSLDATKEWYLRGRFRDKYVVIRFFFNNYENSKIICNFITSNYRLSKR